MGCWEAKCMSLFLVLITFYLQGTYLQKADESRQRKPFFERLRRLEEQFRRFQEVTLTRLQGIAKNYNVSYNINTRFQNLTDEHHTLAMSVSETQAAVQMDLNHLKAWMKKIQRRSRKADSKLLAFERSLNEKSKQSSQEKMKQQEQSTLLASLTGTITQDVSTLQKSQIYMQTEIKALQNVTQLQGARLNAVAEQLQRALQQAAFSPSPVTSSPLLPQPWKEKQQPGQQLLHAKHRHRKKLHQDRLELGTGTETQKLFQDLGRPPLEEKEPNTQSVRQTPPSIDEVLKEPKQPQASQKTGEICNVGSMLVFPNTSTENVVIFSPGFLTGLRELSICTWVRTSSSYLGTLLSYATEENDNKLVLHGKDTLVYGTIHFVIGDPAFRELPVELLLDSRWHHMCVIWSSIQGKYWFYVDRRLVATGSRFREGYEIPPGGILVLGQEQDTMGGGFDSSESFVGSLAGLTVWDRALSPGEVSSITTGKVLPRSVLLTLANASSLEGSVKKVICACLEHCS
ncbi:pentraxin-4 [Sarcophilus harrisii]|uniref:pentraxin-4 n=1 Tax=Sarcophilus harrisii TaxID=9305 RepID=UPI00062B499A|nr:pentraxin-4 [Sarcophilus harrisii]